jgi:CRP-like cAMP-binding protein
METFEHATTHPFLARMEPQHVRRILKTGKEVTFTPNEIIFREGEPADRFFLIDSGKVSLEACAPGREPIEVQILEKGEALGWSWLFPPFAWHFQARALETTRATVFNGADLLVHAEEDPDFGYELMKRVAQVVIQRLQATRRRLVRMETGA